MSGTELKLCSEVDSSDYRIKLHFEEVQTGQIISPQFATREQASEWYVTWLRAHHMGLECRASKRDRRARSQGMPSGQKSYSRRREDKEFRIEDRVRQLLRDIRSLIGSSAISK